MDDFVTGLDLAPSSLSWSAQQHEAIPALAWLTVCEPSNVVIHHGPGVELFERGAFEGAWAGGFAEGTFAQACGVFGSGASADEDGVLFVTPSHTLEALYFQYVGDRFFISNSLAFLLSATRSTPKWERSISRRFATAVLGIEDYDEFLFHTDKGQVHRVIHDNLRWSPERPVERISKPHHPAFSSFSEYRNLLLDVLRALFDNAQDSRRRRPYKPIATCSSGYDSTAGTCLAHALGCDRALTLANGRDDIADSGEEVAAALGMRVTCHPRGDPCDITYAYEFFASGLGIGDVVYTSFQSELAGALLLTGFHGDKMWAPAAKPNQVLERGDTSGSTLGEFRLRSDFVHVPIPFIAARQHLSAYEITRSQEMTPYSLGGSYDRPIPRRIAEEAGVPRDSFGKQKKAASVISRDRSNQPAEFRAEVDAFMNSLGFAHRLATPVLTRIYSRRRGIIKALERRAAATRSKLLKSSLMKVRGWVGGDTRVFRRCIPPASGEFCVAVTHLKARYSLPIRLDREPERQSRWSRTTLPF